MIFKLVPTVLIAGFNLRIMMVYRQTCERRRRMTLSRNSCFKEDDPRKFAEERRLTLLLGKSQDVITFRDWRNEETADEMPKINKKWQMSSVVGTTLPHQQQFISQYFKNVIFFLCVLLFVCFPGSTSILFLVCVSPMAILHVTLSRENLSSYSFQVSFHSHTGEIWRAQCLVNIWNLNLCFLISL